MLDSKITKIFSLMLQMHISYQYYYNMQQCTYDYMLGLYDIYLGKLMNSGHGNIYLL